MSASYIHSIEQAIGIPLVMFPSWWSTLALAVIVTIGGAAVGVNEIMLGPTRPDMPKGDLWVRLTMQGWMIFLAIRGADLLFSVSDGTPQPIAPTALLAGVAMALCQVAMTANTIAHRMSPRAQRRVEQLKKIYRCGKAPGKILAVTPAGLEINFEDLANDMDRPKGDVLVALKLQGAIVVPPADPTSPTVRGRQPGDLSH